VGHFRKPNGTLFGYRDDLQREGGTFFGHHPGHFSIDEHKNMKNRLMPLFDKLMLRKRAIIETIHDQLKNISQIEHTRHRSPVNFLVNTMAALIAYTHKEKKPSLNIRANDLAGLPDIVV
jgi:hypothetical protein